MNNFLYCRLIIILFFVASTNNLAAKSVTKQLSNLAQNYYDLRLEIAQPMAYYYNFKISRHNKFIDNDPVNLKKYEAREDRIYQQLKSIKAADLDTQQAEVFYAQFIESLESSIEQRICKSELWNISHMFGPHSTLNFLINVQPVETEQNKQDALARWGQVALYYDQEIENLNRGLGQGYSVPKRVVKRLLQQINNLISLEIDNHPYLKLSERTVDVQFKKAFKNLLNDQLLPSLSRYSAYLENQYLPAARESLGIHALPKGRECYMALYRSYTTMQRTPETVFEIGNAAVNENIKAVIALGKTLYGETTFAGTVAKASQDKTEEFNSAEQMHEFYVAVVDRAKATMPKYFLKMPSIEMEVEAIPEYQQGAGVSAHYNQGSADRKAKFFYDPTTFPLENFGSGEIVSVHEGYPGHHMQIALVQDIKPFHPVADMFSNSAFSEGWARYSETLAEEAGIFQSKSAKILRRTWPARGMVADTGMHLLGWSNETVAEFLSASGKSFAKAPDVMMDRMAAIPAQLTAYDSGVLQIFALRKKVQAAMGARFNIKDFHHQILKNGNVPMSVLEQQIIHSISNKPIKE